MSPIGRLAYIEIEASDLEAWRNFAIDVLCAEIAETTPSRVLLRIDERTFRIALKQGPLDDLAAVGFEVDTREDFSRTRNALESAGYRPVSGSGAQCAARGVPELMIVTDPAGLAVEVSYGALARPQHPFYPPRPHAGFMTDGQGIGHVLLSVPEVEAARKFYEDVLGFAVSDYVMTRRDGHDARFVFMRCNARHHTLAIGQLPGGKRLVHFMLQCRDIDDVGRALDRVPGSGLRQTRALGRHVNDRMISFYMETPSGVQVEYGWGGREVGDHGLAAATYDVTSIWGHQPL